METTILGRTGLRVSRMGIGCGGPSRLGQRYGASRGNSVSIVREAIDRGVTFIDTAEAYKTEELVGEAIKGLSRDSLVLCTKHSCSDDPTPEEALESVEASLRRLGTDVIDVYMAHGVMPEEYDGIYRRFVPGLLKAREQGKIRHLGISEMFGRDGSHQSLTRALRDDEWDVIMVGFNILNQSARKKILPMAREKNVGVLDMFAVRKALTVPERLREVIAELVASGQVDADAFDPQDPLGFLVGPGKARSVTDAGYRFCLAEPDIDVVLSGTGSQEHLEENFASFAAPRLPGELEEKLRDLFARVDTVSGG